MAWGAVAVGVGAAVSAIGQSISGEQAAKAASKAAKAQLAQERQDRDLAMDAAASSPEELAQLNRAVQINDQDVKRKEQVLASIDPAIIAAGEEALKLIQGEESRTLAPLRNQRQEDRRRLESQLQQQLGPDYANSSAGIRALSRFDSETSLVLAQVQDQAIGRLQGLVTTGAQMNQLGSNVQDAGSLASIFGNISARKINAITGSPINNAGAPFVGDAIRARTLGNVFNTIGQGAMQAGTLYAAGAGGSGGTTGSAMNFGPAEMQKFGSIA